MPPAASPSRSADAPVTSAVSGPTRTRTRFPTCDDRADLARDEVQRRVVGLRAADRRRPTGRRRPRPRRRPRRSRRAARRSRAATRVRPSSWPTARPRRRFAPVNDATNASAAPRRAPAASRAAAARRRRARRPSRRARPRPRSRGSRSASAARARASSSCSSARTLAFVCASSAESGSSRSSDAGVARERAGERDPLPLAARELRRPRVREVRDPEALEQLVDPLACPP